MSLGAVPLAGCRFIFMLPHPQLLIPTPINLSLCQRLCGVLRRWSTLPHTPEHVGCSHTPVVERQALWEALEVQVQGWSHHLVCPSDDSLLGGHRHMGVSLGKGLGLVQFTGSTSLRNWQSGVSPDGTEWWMPCNNQLIIVLITAAWPTASSSFVVALWCTLAYN